LENLKRLWTLAVLDPDPAKIVCNAIAFELGEPASDFPVSLVPGAIHLTPEVLARETALGDVPGIPAQIEKAID